MADPTEWDPTLDHLASRRAQARAMGGSAKVAKQHAAGRLDARQRIAELLDEGSFTEIGALSGAAPADALVAGIGMIDGRPVAVGAEDFTTLGGSIGPAPSRKRPCNWAAPHCSITGDQPTAESPSDPTTGRAAQVL